MEFKGVASGSCCLEDGETEDDLPAKNKEKPKIQKSGQWIGSSLGVSTMSELEQGHEAGSSFEAILHGSNKWNMLELEKESERLMLKAEKRQRKQRSEKNGLGLFSWIKNWKLKQTEKKIQALLTSLSPKLKQTENELRSWIDSVVGHKDIALTHAQILLLGLTASVDQYQYSIDYYDELFNDCLQIGYDVKQEIDDLYTALLFSKEIFKAHDSKNKWKRSNNKKSRSIRSSDSQSGKDHVDHSVKSRHSSHKSDHRSNNANSNCNGNVSYPMEVDTDGSSDSDSDCDSEDSDNGDCSLKEWCEGRDLKRVSGPPLHFTSSTTLLEAPIASVPAMLPCALPARMPSGEDSKMNNINNVNNISTLASAPIEPSSPIDDGAAVWQGYTGLSGCRFGQLSKTPTVLTLKAIPQTHKMSPKGAAKAGMAGGQADSSGKQSMKGKIDVVSSKEETISISAISNQLDKKGKDIEVMSKSYFVPGGHKVLRSKMASDSLVDRLRILDEDEEEEEEEEDEEDSASNNVVEPWLGMEAKRSALQSHSVSLRSLKLPSNNSSESQQSAVACNSAGDAPKVPKFGSIVRQLQSAFNVLQRFTGLGQLHSGSQSTQNYSNTGDTSVVLSSGHSDSSVQASQGQGNDSNNQIIGNHSSEVKSMPNSSKNLLSHSVMHDEMLKKLDYMSQHPLMCKDDDHMQMIRRLRLCLSIKDSLVTLMSVLKAASDTEVANMKKHKKLKKELEEMCAQEGLVLTAGSTTHNNNSPLTFHYNCTQTTQTFTYITNSTDPIPSLVQSFVSAGDMPSPTNSSYSRASAPLQPIDTSSKCPSQFPNQFPVVGGEGQIPHSLNAIEDRQSFSKSSVVATESLASSTSQGSTACETLQSETAALECVDELRMLLKEEKIAKERLAVVVDLMHKASLVEQQLSADIATTTT